MEKSGFVVDTAQQHTVALLDDLFDRLVEVQPANWWQDLFSPQGKWPKITGIYIWGGVGSGQNHVNGFVLPFVTCANRV